MNRKLKLFGTILVAALAMSSVAVSMASADVITSESAAVTTVTGSQEGTDVLKVHGGEIRCFTVTYTGSFSSGASSVLVTPTYSNCSFGSLVSTFDMNGCQYRVNFTGGTSTEGSIDIVCPIGSEITVTTPSIGTKKCILHIPPQTDLTKVTGTNIGSGTTRELTLDINITNIKYSQTAGTAETGNCATADNTTGGTYTGKAVVTGSVGGAHVGIFLS
jgi:hypothetical protein